MIKNICKAENIDIKQLSPRFILAIIDRWKKKGFYPSEVIINKKDIYEKTILPTDKKYKEVLRKDTSFPKYFHSKLVWKPDKRDYEREVVNPLDVLVHGVLRGKR